MTAPPGRNWRALWFRRAGDDPECSMRSPSVSGLPASMALRAAASARDRTMAGQLAEVTWPANAVASYSASLPVVVLIDSAELLDAGLVERLCLRDPGSQWFQRAGRRCRNPRRTSARALHAARALRPPVGADRHRGRGPSHGRVAAQTRSFADIWVALNLPAATDLADLKDLDDQLRLVDRLATLASYPGPPPGAARVLALAGGLMHEEQLTAAVRATGGDPIDYADGVASAWVTHLGHGVRLAPILVQRVPPQTGAVVNRTQSAGCVHPTTERRLRECRLGAEPASRYAA